MKKIILTAALVLASATGGYAASSLFQGTKEKLIPAYADMIHQEITQMNVDNSSDIDVFLTDEKERVRVETMEYLKKRLDGIRKEKGQQQEEAKENIRKEADQAIKEVNSEIDRIIQAW